MTIFCCVSVIVRRLATRFVAANDSSFGFPTTKLSKAKLGFSGEPRLPLIFAIALELKSFPSVSRISMERIFLSSLCHKDSIFSRIIV
ncbi:unnamed protein product [Onchocerca flexuosa]|uniref:Secreted protein n=1 Tax=Onchocerca flexuosa TaxID=387005 RepID=A0A183H711_9BILA|nr:unnamed protein product [Onchocerca flexuosa]